MDVLSISSPTFLPTPTSKLSHSSRPKPTSYFPTSSPKTPSIKSLSLQTPKPTFATRSQALDGSLLISSAPQTPATAMRGAEGDAMGLLESPKPCLNLNPPPDLSYAPSPSLFPAPSYSYFISQSRTSLCKILQNHVQTKTHIQIRLLHPQTPTPFPNPIKSSEPQNPAAGKTEDGKAAPSGAIPASTLGGAVAKNGRARTGGYGVVDGSAC